MNYTLYINGINFSSYVASIQVKKEITYRKVITTLDDVEHPYPSRTRNVVTVGFLPMDEAQATKLYDAMNVIDFSLKYTDPTANGETRALRARVASDIDLTFALTSFDGKRRYIGGEIVLREA